MARGAQDARCRAIFVDVGANAGDSLQLFFEAEGCVDLKARMGDAWPGIRKARCRWELPPWLPLSTRRTAYNCAHAFEPNPRMVERLVKTSRALEASIPGLRISIHNGTAFGTQDGTAPFYIDGASKHSVGSSLVLPTAARRAEDTTVVRTVDGVNFLRGLDRGVPIELKMDIEGSEEEVVRDLISSGVLCERVSNLWVEWHDTGKHKRPNESAPWISLNLPGAVRPESGSVKAVYKWMLRSMTTGRNANAERAAGMPQPPLLGPHCRTMLQDWA